MNTPPPPNAQDRSHLEALAVAHTVIGGLGILFACLPLIYVIMGILILTGGSAHATASGEFPMEIGLIFVLVGGLCFFLGEVMASCVITSGGHLKQQRNYMFSFIVACLLCAFIPVGTMLGIFTIIVLNRPSVKQLYGRTF